MKTAVSIPNDVFEAAEDLAHRTGVSRSELYANALRALLVNDHQITMSLAAVYTEVDQIEPSVKSAARRVFAKTEW